MADRGQTRRDPAFSEALGRAIKMLRAARGLPRKALAEAAGISYPYLSEIESGAKPGSSRALRPIAEALGVPLHELFATAEELLAGGTPPSVPPLEAASASFAAMPPTARPSRWFRTPTPLEPADSSRRPSRETRLGELLRLAGSVSDDDLDRLLDLARRLSG